MKKATKIISAAVITGAVYFLFFLTGMGCPIRYFTGISCMGCGMTRAAIKLCMLDIKSAFYYHPLVFFIPVYALLFFFKKKFITAFNIITKIFVFLFIAVYFIRLFNPQNSIVTANIKDGCIFKFINFITGGFFYG